MNVAPALPPLPGGAGAGGGQGGGQGGQAGAQAQALMPPPPPPPANNQNPVANAGANANANANAPPNNANQGAPQGPPQGAPPGGNPNARDWSVYRQNASQRSHSLAPRLLAQTALGNVGNYFAAQRARVRAATYDGQTIFDAEVHSLEPSKQYFLAATNEGIQVCHGIRMCAVQIPNNGGQPGTRVVTLMGDTSQFQGPALYRTAGQVAHQRNSLFGLATAPNAGQNPADWADIKAAMDATQDQDHRVPYVNTGAWPVVPKLLQLPAEIVGLLIHQSWSTRQLVIFLDPLYQSLTDPMKIQWGLLFEWIALAVSGDPAAQPLQTEWTQINASAGDLRGWYETLMMERYPVQPVQPTTPAGGTPAQPGTGPMDIVALMEANSKTSIAAFHAGVGSVQSVGPASQQLRSSFLAFQREQLTRLLVCTMADANPQDSECKLMKIKFWSELLEIPSKKESHLRGCAEQWLLPQQQKLEVSDPNYIITKCSLDAITTANFEGSSGPLTWSNRAHGLSLYNCYPEQGDEGYERNCKRRHTTQAIEDGTATRQDRREAEQVDKDPPNPVSKTTGIQYITNLVALSGKMGSPADNECLVGLTAVKSTLLNVNPTLWLPGTAEFTPVMAIILWHLQIRVKQYYQGKAGAENFRQFATLIDNGLNVQNLLIPYELNNWIQETFYNQAPVPQLRLPAQPQPVQQQQQLQPAQPNQQQPPQQPPTQQQDRPPFQPRINSSPWSMAARELWKRPKQHYQRVNLTMLLEGSSCTAVADLLPESLSRAGAKPCGQFWVLGKCNRANCRFEHDPSNIPAPATDLALARLKACVDAFCNRDPPAPPVRQR